MPPKKQPLRYCGRQFTEQEIGWILDLIAGRPDLNRQGLSALVCEGTGWRKPDGGLKDMSCRVALLKMERDGLLRLPARQAPYHRPRAQVARTLRGEPKPVIERKAGDLALRFEAVTSRTSALWNELVDRYHYLGYKPLPGAQLRYLVHGGEDLVALLGFGAAAWAVEVRDQYIGWSREERRQRLPLVVNNARFLVLPWVQSRNLCSRILSLAARRLPTDWEERYRVRPVLLETFVDKSRFAGTCYKASGWACVGETKGRGKLDRKNEYKLPVKTVWLYPLARDFRSRLCGSQS